MGVGHALFCMPCTATPTQKPHNWYKATRLLY